MADEITLRVEEPETGYLRYMHEGDAGLDLRAAEDCWVLGKAMWTMMVPTGVRVEIPEGYVGLVVPRSGLATQERVTVINSPGVIDSGYRGEIKVGLVNYSSSHYRVHKGDRIAQLLIMPVAKARVVRVDSVDEDTERGSDGFGSSGF